VDTIFGEGRKLTCGDRTGVCSKEKPVKGDEGESNNESGRLRIDLVEAVLWNAARVGETMPFLKID